MDKKELKKILEISNKIKNAVKGKKEPIKEEKITMKFAFASVVARRNIEKGETISEKNICLKRPGNGYFKFNQFRKLLGKKAKKYICENTQLKRKDIF
jgi:N-acetylneuraminate synthase